MKKNPGNSLTSFRAALRSAARAARRTAFRKGKPIAVSKDGKVLIVYKDKKEVEFSSDKDIN